MSGADYAPSDGASQDDSSEKNGDDRLIFETDNEAEMLELKRAEMQMELGFLTRKNVVRVCGVSYDTVKLWEARGLLFSKDGTKEHWCKVNPLKAFIAALGEPEEHKPKARKK